MIRCKTPPTADRRRFAAVTLSSLLAIALILSGCAGDRGARTDDSAAGPPAGPARITGLDVVEGIDTVDVLIRGDRPLTYTSVTRPNPPAFVLRFTGATLDVGEGTGRYTIDVPFSRIIEAVIAAEESEGGRPVTRLEIALGQDRTPEIIREGEGLRIAFADPGAGAPRSAEFDDGGDDPLPMAHTASRLESIYATRLEDSLKVFVGADGAITNYKAYTIDNPPRIIFDIFNLKSPYRDEKQVAVDTSWVKRIRYFGYPDRLRLVLETQPQYLTAFSANPVDNGLLVNVGTAERFASKIPPPSPDRAGAERHPLPPGAAEANRLQSVYATQLDDSTLVTVRGDGAITDYRTDSRDDPASIIVDLFNIDNPYEQTHAFPVDTRYVKQVRYESLADRLRLYIDTHPRYLSAFTTQPDKDGLIIRVGSGEAPAPAGPAPEPPPAPPRTYAEGGKPAWINRIDFLSEDAGRSTLIVGTTRPVPYDLVTTGDNQLALKLDDTRIPDYRERPLITDRFESAVDEIIPRRNGGPGQTTVFDIRLREGVPYYVEQTDDMLMVHFEASSISPKPSAVPAVADAGAPPGGALPSDQTAPPTSPETPPAAFPSERAAGDFDMPTSPPSGGFDAAPAGDFATAPDARPSPEGPSEAELLLGRKPTYTGEKIALDFYETDIKNVFRILREVSGKNFAVDNDVDGRVTLTLEHPVPWDQVLDLVLKMNGLGKTFEGDIIRIATKETLKDEEQERQERLMAAKSAKDQEKALEPLKTEYIPINYSNAQAEILPHLEKVKTADRGTLSVDTRTNMIIMTDTEEKIKQAKEIVSKLDRVTPQVIIEARVVEATTNFTRQIGTSWGAQGGLSEATDENAIADQGYGPQRGYNVLGGTYGWDMAMNLPVPSTSGSLGFNFMRIAGTPLTLDAQLMAMESTGEAKIISAPKVLTLDNKKATIKQGISYPYQTVEDGEVNIEFQDVDLLLEVTPHVTPDNRISMVINITKNDLGPRFEGQQSFTTKEAITELLVNDGDTVVIGGIIKTTERSSNESIPGLSKIPILGWLFKSKEKTEDKEELLIFITPRIVQLEQRQTEI